MKKKPSKRGKCELCERRRVLVKDGLCSECYAYTARVNANCEEIERVYGKDRAAHANIGWGESDESICSKVYALKDGEETMCVSTWAVGDGFEHDHTPY